MDGLVTDELIDRPETDEEDIEEVLLQVMRDEFEVEIEDGSEGIVSSHWEGILQHISHFSRLPKGYSY